jgi:hypothetical protein
MRSGFDAMQAVFGQEFGLCGWPCTIEPLGLPSEGII